MNANSAAVLRAIGAALWAASAIIQALAVLRFGQDVPWDFPLIATVGGMMGAGAALIVSPAFMQARRNS